MDFHKIPFAHRSPDFQNLLDVLARKSPSRPTLFEFFLNEPLYRRLVPEIDISPGDRDAWIRLVIQAYQRLGYDSVNLVIPGFSFTENRIERKKARSVSMDEGSVIHNRRDFQSFSWPDPDQADYDILARLAPDIPDGIKIVAYGPGGVLENVVELIGYEAVCVMIYDDPALARDIFGEIGSRLVRYYELACQSDAVGACISNDDWGFKTQTMFSPKDMREYVFPWHKRIVETIHAAGRPAILHSCGHFQRVIEDVIEDMKYDARHSYEDSIMPVEDFYEIYHGRIAILGGIDLDFVCREPPEKVYQRSKAMLRRAKSRGGFALGTGNSVPDYVPDENFFALIQAALDENE